jgi:cobalt-zinc-cadmium efflux system outer membrane protein
MQSTFLWTAASRYRSLGVRTRAHSRFAAANGRCRGPALRVVLVLALGLAVSPHTAIAQQDELTLRQALEYALAQNKQLAAFEHRLAERKGQLQQAGLRPNPQVDLEFENFGGQGDFRGFDGAESTLSIGWAIEPWLRERRIGAAEARSAGTHLDAQILRLDVAAETAQRFLSCLESQAHLKTADEAVALGERTVAAVERRVRAGHSPRADLSQARAELAIERLSRDDVTHEQSVAYHRLAAQWGETAPSFARVSGALLTLPTVAPFDELATRIEENPQLLRLASEQRIAEAELRLEKVRRFPTLTPSLGARRLEITNDWAIVAGLTVPFPLFDRNQGRVAESQAGLARKRADSDAERVRVHTTLYEVYQEMQHSVHRAEVLGEEVIPRLEEAMEATSTGYEQGRYRYSELRLVEADLLAARRSLVEASTAAHRLVIALERLTGERMAR